MYAQDIYRLINKDKKMSQTFKGVYSMSSLPKYRLSELPASLAVLVKSQHWILIYLESQKATVFDSYAENLGFYGENLKKWFKTLNYQDIELNNKVVQSDTSKKCGLFVIFVLYYLVRNLSLSTIMKKFVKSTKMNDIIVSKFAYQKFGYRMPKSI